MVKSTSKLKVFLIQLPHPSYIDRNVPLAPGYLKASAYSHGLLEVADIEILDPIVSDYSGCQRLIDDIVSMKADVLGFSLYLWNVERTLYIIDKIKARLPKLKILVGGSEVSLDSKYIFANPNIDIFVIGEGEITFVELMSHILSGEPELGKIPGICYRKNNDIVVNTARKRIEDIELIPSPYLLRFIDPNKYREMMLFTMRGCMLGCSYCSWTARGKLRAFAIERLKNELTLANDIGKEMIVSILDSAFNASPVFVEFCNIAKEINKDKALKFNCFVQADLIDKKMARLLKESNFTGVEVGLQSAKAEVLTLVNRFVDLTKFLNGVSILQSEGISVKVDTILGLPGDSLGSFEETMMFIDDNNLDCLLFNLSMVHGAKLRRQAKQFGIKAQNAPPFYVLETDTFSRQDLQMAVHRYVEKSADFNKMTHLYYPSIVSKLYGSNWFDNGYDISCLRNMAYPIGGLVLEVDRPHSAIAKVTELAEVVSHKVSSNLSVLCKGNNKNRLTCLCLLRPFLSEISRKNPYITWNIFLEMDDYGLDQEIIEEVLSFIQRPKSFLDYRDEFFPKNLSCVRRGSVNVFALVPYMDDQNDLKINESNCIRIFNIMNQSDLRSQVQQIIEAQGCGLLVDLPKQPAIDFVRDAMGLLYASGKNIFFKDWVLQRLWEQEYLKITPENQPHYELVVDPDLNLTGGFFDEHELLWDAVTRWRMVKTDYYGSDIERVILQKITSMFSV